MLVRNPCLCELCSREFSHKSILNKQLLIHINCIWDIQQKIFFNSFSLTPILVLILKRNLSFVGKICNKRFLKSVIFTSMCNLLLMRKLLFVGHATIKKNKLLNKRNIIKSFVFHLAISILTLILFH